MATDREAARRQRLRGAQTRDIIDADTSFGFRLPGAGAPSTIIASEAIVEAQIATPTPAPATRRTGRPGIGGTKRSSPTLDIENIPDRTAAPQDGSTRLTETNEQAAKRQRIEPAVADDSTSRVAGRNKRLRGAQLRSPGVGVQDFGFILPPAPPAAVSIATTERDIQSVDSTSAPREQGNEARRNQRLRGAQLRSPGVGVEDFGLILPPIPPAAPSVATTETDLQPADFTSAPPQEGNETRTPRAATPEYQVLAETTNASIRSSGAASGTRSLRSSARRDRSNRSTEDRDVEVGESPPGKPGSGRRVHVSVDRTENSDAAEAAARRLNDVVGTPTRTGRGSLGREASPTLTVERPRERADERQDRDEDEDMDELSPDRPKTTRTSSPRRSTVDEDVSLESVRESIEGKDDDAEEEASPISDTEAAAALRRNRAPKGTYAEPRPDKDLDADSDASDQYEESADSDAAADTVTAAQQRKRLAKVGRKRKNGDITSPAVQKPARDKTGARTATLNADGSEPRKRGRPKGSKNNPKTASKARAQNMGPRSKETIAVQTYRLSNFAPPAELEAEGDEELDEVLTQPIPFPNLPRNTGGVNSIDVLSQMLNEVLQSALENLEQGAAMADEAAQRRQTAEKVAERREYRTKLRAVEAWGEAAGGALMKMGLGLDAAVAMNKRLKEVEKERLELRERLSEIRRERERVGVRGDGVRSRHEREGSRRQADRELQSAIEGVSVLVGVCREQEGGEEDDEVAKPDIITRLQDTARMVGSGSNEGEGGSVGKIEGLLERLRRLNGLLERAAGALEGR